MLKPPCHPPGRSGRFPHDDRQNRDPLWPEATLCGGGQRLRLCRQSGLAGQTQEDCPAYSGVRQIHRTDGTFSRSDFTRDGENDRYICPAAKELMQFHRTYATPDRGSRVKVPGFTGPARRIAMPATSNSAAARMQLPAKSGAIAMRMRDVARAIAETPDYERSRHRRKKVEMLFAHLKRILKMARLRLRGPCGARDEFLLAATAQNLRRLAQLRPSRLPTAAFCAFDLSCALAQIK